MPVGYTKPLLLAAAGNPYGMSFVSGMHADRPDSAILDAARNQGHRLAEIASRLEADVIASDAPLQT